MVPDISLRLQAMYRAMTEIIAPAIPAQNKLAAEQAGLVIAFLQLLSAQHDKVFNYEFTELKEFSALASALIGAAEGGPITQSSLAEARSTLDHAAPIAALQIPRQGEIVSLVRSLRQSCEQLVRAAYADGSPSFGAAATEFVMTQSGKEIDRARAWISVLHMDPEPATILAIDDLLV